jgi:cytochrome P450
MQHPPGPRGRAALGFFGAGSLRGVLSFFEKTARQYGPVSSFRLLNKRIYLVNDADLIQELLVTRQHEFIRDAGATLGRELVGDGLLTLEEPLHKERRRVLQPAFHRDQIASYAAVMIAESERLAGEWQGRESVEIRSEMRRLTLSIVGATLFGADFSDSAGQIADVLKRVTRRGSWLAPLVTFIEPLVLAYRHVHPQGRSLFFPRERRELEQIVAPIIESRRGSNSCDMLSLILNQREQGEKALTSQDVQNEVVTFVLAGHETTASALTWTWYLLAQHPERAACLHAELDRVLGGRAPSLDDVPGLPYTANLFKEAMRLYPPALLFARRPKQDLDFAGYRIARHQSIFVSPYITQRDEKYFERPDSFEPERWEHQSIPKFAYFPFGGGAKMCIGEPFARLEGVVALATLAQRWTLDRETEIPVGIANGAILNPDQPIVMRPQARLLPVR